MINLKVSLIGEAEKNMYNLRLMGKDKFKIDLNTGIIKYT
jgi:hypothetical protein